MAMLTGIRYTSPIAAGAGGRWRRGAGLVEGADAVVYVGGVGGGHGLASGSFSSDMSKWT